MIGHGQAINDLAVFPTQPHLLLTASKVINQEALSISHLSVQDESARIWNLKTGITVCTVAGDDGHTAEVLSIVHAYKSDLLNLSLCRTDIWMV